MSLKTPLFLILIVGSLCLIIFMIWPDFKEISVAQQKLKEAQLVAAGIQEKNANMASLIASMNDSQNLDRKEFVLNYIPMDRKEELIFNTLSRIANSEGVNVVLSGASLVNQKEEAPIAVAEMSQSSQEIIFGDGTNPDGTAVPASVLPSERKIETSILVLGKYENIKKFIERVYALDMLKNISDVSLASVKDEKGNATENISANITAELVYIPEARINNDYNNPIFEKESFDFAIVDQTQALLSQKAEIVTVEGVGKDNPFLP